MPTYYPLDIGVALRASRSDLIDLRWSAGDITADFELPDRQDQALRVFFDCPCIVRLLDEMPLSTETDNSLDIGRVPEHFAYRVEGANFEAAQSETWKEAIGPLTHYQFVTGMTCMDVLAKVAPVFTLIPFQSTRGRQR
jgi:hypothetical protein